MKIGIISLWFGVLIFGVLMTLAGISAADKIVIGGGMATSVLSACLFMYRLLSRQ